MKRLLILVITIAIAFSQGIGVGVKGGTISASNSIDDTSESGFLFGGMMKLDVIFATVDIEALYSTYGDDITTSHLQIPATVRMGLLPIPFASLYARGGVQYDYLIGASGNANFEDLVTEFGQSGMSIVIGAGAELDLPILPGAILDFRYIIPTYDFWDEGYVKDVKALGGNLKNFHVTQFQITFGMTF